MYDRRFTPDRISELKENEIFVFGSNLAGSHGGGAARFAYERFGAVWGEGVGLHGQAYAIPTMQGGVETIKPYVDEFIRFAQEHSRLTFLVTRIGCGIAGFRGEQGTGAVQGEQLCANLIQKDREMRQKCLLHLDLIQVTPSIWIFFSNFALMQYAHD